MVLTSPAYGSKSQDNISTAQGGGPQILSTFVKQRTYQLRAHTYSAHLKLSRHTGDLFGRITKVRLASPEELPRKPRIFLRVMIHLKVLNALNAHIFPAGRYIEGSKTTTARPRTRQFSHGGSPIRSGATRLESHCSRDNQARMNQTART
jgi:hypothetical protein